MNRSSITIVTALFDIGRKDWTVDKGFKEDYNRTTDTYLNYFKNLAKLDNQMIIFTSTELRDKIEKIREGKPTVIVVIDFHKKFKFLVRKIRKIQLSESYKKMIPSNESKKPEYISPEYVLVTNLKSYFVIKALKMNLVKNDVVAWVDFGYCRTDRTINGIKEWNYPFEKDKINCFTINKLLQISSKNEAIDEMLKGTVLTIGGALVGTKDSWLNFYIVICELYKKALKEQFVDDDQYFITMCYYESPKLVKLNYLGKSRWFDLFKRYGCQNLCSYWWRIRTALKLT